MTSRERLRRAYFHEDMDRPGIYSRTMYPADDPSYDKLKAFLEARTELKEGWNVFGLETPGPEEFVTEPVSEDFERRITILHTPAGDLRSSALVSLRGQPGLCETYFIETREDAEKYLSLPPAHIVSDDVSEFFRRDAGIGDRGITEVRLGANPGGHAAQLCGSENFAILSLTDRDILEALCARHMETQLKRVKFLTSKNVGPCFSMAGEEYIVPPLHGPRDFNDFNVKYNKPIIDLIHESGGRVHTHCHGSVGKVFDGFLEMGTDVLHPIEPPPMGDISAREAKERARGRMALEGNIQIADLYEHSPDDIRQQTEALIRDAFDDQRGLIVCPTASPYIRGKGEDCLPQYQAMVRAVLEW